MDTTPVYIFLWGPFDVNQATFSSTVKLDIVNTVIWDAFNPVACARGSLAPERFIIIDLFEFGLMDSAHRVFLFSVSSCMDSFVLGGTCTPNL
jgi:hypothetical protein